MRAIKQNFNANRGDIVYGLREARSFYYTKLGISESAIEGLDKAWVQLDCYNNQHGVWDADAWETPSQIKSKLSTIKKRNEELTDSSQDPQLAARRRAYYQSLMSSRFSPERVLHMTTEEFERRIVQEKGKTVEGFYRNYDKKQGITLESGKESDSGSFTTVRSYIVIRRACKFGIGMLAKHQQEEFRGAKIQFLLDGLDLRRVAAKTGIDGENTVPITFSELRYTFRNWAALRNIVNFYVRGHLVKPPWEEDYTLPTVFSELPTDKKWNADISACPYVSEFAVGSIDDWAKYAKQRQLKYDSRIPYKDLI